VDTQKKWAAGALLIAAGLALGSAASAAPFADVVTGPENIVVGKPYSFQHQIADNGYVPGTPITAATLSIVLGDDNGNESYTFTFGSGQSAAYSTNINNSTPAFVLALSTASLAALSAAGTMNVKIAADSCTSCSDFAFRFVSSTLTAEVGGSQRNRLAPTAVPEPGTWSLLGLGLAGLAALGRRRSIASTGIQR